MRDPAAASALSQQIFTLTGLTVTQLHLYMSGLGDGLGGCCSMEHGDAKLTHLDLKLSGIEEDGCRRLHTALPDFGPEASLP
eukprot:3249586-Rhodomonas_salina.3